MQLALASITVMACTLSLFGCTVSSNATLPAGSSIASQPFEPPAASPLPPTTQAAAPQSVLASASDSAVQATEQPNSVLAESPTEMSDAGSGTMSDDAVGDVEPEVGMITDIQSGDLMCYLTFLDASGTERQVGASFEICAQPELYIHQRVRLIYGVANVNDCTSNEPCGKTRRVNLVTKIDYVDEAGVSRPAPTAGQY